MEKKYLTVNIGSASKKYAFYANGREMWRAHFEKEDNDFVVTFLIGDRTKKTKIKKEDFKNSIAFLRNRIGDAVAIGIRIVAPGEYFLKNRVIDGKFLEKLKAASEQAPLHIAPVFAEISQLRKFLPKAKLIAVSDSAFYADMPEQARLYSLPESVAKKFGIYRYGYHGISIRSVIRKIKKLVNPFPPRAVICHLGSGSTVAAVKNGKSFDTSMGFTPMEGLPMGTRIGNIDAGAVIYLAKKSGMKLEELESFFNKQCGLLGLSGKTADVRKLIELEKSGDKKSALALDNFIYHIKKYIGAYAAAMGGLDLLVFTATIGERSFIVRRRICSGLGEFGIKIDETKNKATVSRDGFINKTKSKTKIAVITTDELKEIYNQIRGFRD